ncbi:MAG: amino-acid N-acetyltransferase [Burkholderiales bacterium]|jgi:amino-acid N-acetyltransferase|nr:amino-acid N-acetyltransferase [Burkholderiales bacterium]
MEPLELTSSAALKTFVQGIRAAVPYIYAFRDSTFVITLGGDVVDSESFLGIVHDLNLLHSLGIRLVVVHGMRPQIESILAQQNIESHYAEGIRITDPDTMDCVLEAAGQVRSRIEALLSLGLANSPMAGSRNRVASGNYLTAKPYGVIAGKNMQFTGEVRRVDREAIQQRLDDGDIVLISPIGYSPTGEIFNLTMEEVAAKVAVRLEAMKLIFISDDNGLRHGNKRLDSISTDDAEALIKHGKRLPESLALYLPQAIHACRGGVPRVHFLSSRKNGALLIELFTRQGIGTMLSHHPLESLRVATIDDIGSILALIEPLEEQGILVRRSRERLEAEIERFIVVEYDNLIIGCAALHPFPEESVGEMAALAVHPEFQREGYGESLLHHVETWARKLGLKDLFVLTTRTAHWFLERGFRMAPVSRLPQQKKSLYNYKRNSQVYWKTL